MIKKNNDTQMKLFDEQMEKKMKKQDQEFELMKLELQMKLSVL